MISCTEFILSYSELFSFLEKNYGKDEVERFWTYLFTPDGKGIPLINFLEKEGIRGCYSYWMGTLNEEAADFTMYLNEKEGWFKTQMHHCPSKGRLLKFRDEIGITPYPDYCLHCDHYRESIEKVGLNYLYDFCGTDKASCTLLVTDPKRFKNKLIVDDSTVIVRRSASDNEYFHKDFHSSLNNGIQYLGETKGEEAVRSYLSQFTANVYKREIASIREKGIEAIKEKIIDTYNKEKCPEVLNISEEGNKTTFEISCCPAVRHLNETGRPVSPWFSLTTEVIMEEFAKAGGLTFKMEEYEPETGKAKYSFIKK